MRYVSLVDDALIGTPSGRVHAHSHFQLTFTLHGGRERIRLVLDPNHDLIHQDFGVTILAHDGTVREVQRPARSEHKVYRGEAFVDRPAHGGWSKAGWARIVVYRDGQRPLFDGAFAIDGDNHHVQTATQYQRLRDPDDPVVDFPAGEDASMVVWRDSDVIDDDGDGDGDGDLPTELKRSLGRSDEAVCGADSLDFNARFDSGLQSPNPLRAIEFRSLFGRQSTDNGGTGGPIGGLINSIGSVDGCPTTRKVALVGIATDCNYWDGFATSEDVRRNVISMVNRASEVYESTFRISLGIQNLTISERSCPGSPPPAAPWNVPCGNETTITDRLNSFSRWRGQFRDSNAYWTLLTRCATDTAVGLAWRGQVCRTGSGSSNGNSETVAAANVVVRTDTEWQVFAHESGHTFGAVHDCTSSSCSASGEACCPLSRTACDAAGRFIMNPSTGRGITQFSPCSIGNICSGLRSSMIMRSCLTDNRNVNTITGSQCGNGIVEDGEDCDCGGEQGCGDNRCCNPTTCRFAANAVCDASNEDCCTADCRFASNGTVCRASTGVCDIAEVCPGDQASCPADRHRDDGDACADGLECASGQCTSRDQQCRSMVNSFRGVNNTRACPTSGCLLSCQSPDMAPGQCATYNQYFVDGTPCGAGGRCANGACEGRSTAREISEWIQNNKAIFIPIVSVVGGLVVVALLSCVFGAIRRRIRRRRLPRRKPAPETNSWPSSSYSAVGPGPPQYWAGGGGQGQGHQQWARSSGAMAMAPDDAHAHYYQQQQQQQQGVHDFSVSPPPPPPPTAGDGGRWMTRQGSTRYA